MKTKKNKKIISDYCSHKKILFICLNTLFVGRARGASTFKKKTQMPIQTKPHVFFDQIKDTFCAPKRRLQGNKNEYYKEYNKMEWNTYSINLFSSTKEIIWKKLSLTLSSFFRIYISINNGMLSLLSIRIIFRYFQNTKNGSSSSHIYDGVYSLNS